ncbi:MAG TPA: cytochrome c oxidase assembly protein [Candidatus Limnocylindrales bacterium]|nr:cytochrome c oxidase assembly protein [Candidatus Limnocylindrales bacterium]
MIRHAALGGFAILLAVPATVAAHGVAPQPTSIWSVLLAWSIEAHVLLPLLGLVLVYAWAVREVDRAHPHNPVPRWRPWAWYSGVAVLFVALSSPIATYDTTLFSAHMVQHLLMTMIAAPLLAIGAPITLLLRVSSAATRRRWILPVLHSRLLRAISFPVVTWVIFAAVMWASHFSPLFDAALEDEAAHLFEHALFLGAALLFWWPVVGADPSPWRLPHAARLGYLIIGLPFSSFLGLVIFSAPGVLYSHYETLVRPWGPTPLEDQQLAGAIMWGGGDLLFLGALILALWVWLRAEEVEGRRADAKLDRDAATARRAAPTATPQPPGD